MLKKFLKEVITLIVGKAHEQVADLLDNEKYINEFVIAKKMDITINQARNILYKLADQGLVSSIREKDKKKGWYTYFWKIEVLKSLDFLRLILEKNISQIENQKNSRESKQFYVCERCNIEFSEENALLRNFICNECGEVFSLKDNTKVLKELNRHLERLNKDLVLVEEEIAKEKERIEQERKKYLMKQEKIKKKSKKIKSKIKKITKKKLRAKKKKIVKKKISRKNFKKKKIKKRKNVNRKK